MGHTHICLPFARAGQYREDVDDPAQYRQSLAEMRRQYPELFPQERDQGFPLHDGDVSIKQALIMRRITLHTTGAVFTLRPSFVMPARIARTAAVETALSLRQLPVTHIFYFRGSWGMLGTYISTITPRATRRQRSQV